MPTRPPTLDAEDGPSMRRMIAGAVLAALTAAGAAVAHAAVLVMAVRNTL